MGWISKRFLERGGKWGRPVDERKRKAPLRKIVSVLVARADMFGSDLVELECGHRMRAYGSLRARCTDCAAADARRLP